MDTTPHVITDDEWREILTLPAVQCPRIFYTDLDTLICKMRQPTDLQGEQDTSGRSRPMIARHVPDGPL
jgi:hypothetical protein